VEAFMSVNQFNESRLPAMVFVAGIVLATCSYSEAVESNAFAFRKEVTNLEFLSVELSKSRPPQLLSAHHPDGELMYGLIPRRQPSDELTAKGQFIPFMVRIEDGIVIQAWVDGDLDGRLTEDSRVPLSAYPRPDGARSFLVELRWAARTAARAIPVSSTIRVVLEPMSPLEHHMIYRLQSVYSMIGRVEMQGKVHHAILFDGNFDGLYRQSFGDGLFVDMNDDHHFNVDTMSGEFGSATASFRMGTGLYSVESIDDEGVSVRIKEELGFPSYVQAAIGVEAPDFLLTDLEGKRHQLSDYREKVVLVYFWTSWCGACAAQAEPLRTLHEKYSEKGLEILAVSFDTDRTAMNEFRKINGQSWPTSFTGKSFWDNEIGRLFGADGSGMIYLIEPSGKLEGMYVEMTALVARVDTILGPMNRSMALAAESAH
jgi:thiol-disulfide isomerase/thioredoxin